MLAFMRKHPLACYFALTIGISWAAVLAVILPGSVPAHPDDADRLFPLVYLSMLLGPPVAGVFMTWVSGGSHGVRSLWKRLLTWRVPGHWFLVALLTAPVVLGATLLVLLPLSADFSPAFLHAGGSAPIAASSPMAFIFLSLLIGIGAGFFEEIGWTGFATPRLTGRGMGSILFLGFFWGFWHFLPIWWGSGGSFGNVPVPIFMIVALFSFLPPYRILMTWVYEQTESLLVAVLMHASLTSSMLIMTPAVSGADSLTHNVALAGILWCAVATGYVLRSRSSAAPVAPTHPTHAARA